MIKTTVFLLLFGGAALWATLSMVGTPHAGQAFVDKHMKGDHRSVGGRAYMGGGPRSGK